MTARFQCQFCDHEFETLASFLGHQASKHPEKAKQKYPPHTVFHEMAIGDRKPEPKHNPHD